MTCSRFTWNQLSDYADGALPPVTRWQVRRHVRNCKLCASQLAELESLATMARARFDGTVAPTTLTQNALSALPEPFLQKEVKKMIRRYQAQAAFATVGTLAVAASVGAAVVTPLLYPTPALADVSAAMGKLKTLQWDQSVETHKVATWSEEIRRTRAVCAVDLALKGVRIDEAETRYFVSRGGEALYVNGKYARRLPRANAASFSILAQDPGSWISHTSGGWTRTEEVVKGVRLLRFEDTTEGKGQQPTYGGGFQRWTYWIDPKTRLLVRTEEEQTALGQEGTRGVTRTVRENFRYNAPLATERFSTALPVGTRLVK